jgi:hypothetical protein
MNRDARAEELNNLKVALATFALRLDAFEARLKSRSFEKPANPPAAAIEPQFAKNIILAMKRDAPVGHPKSR